MHRTGDDVRRGSLLDGVAAGIFGVIAVLFVVELTAGSGQFDLSQGIMALRVGVSAALTNALTGVVATHAGARTGFLVLAALALVALAFTAFAVREHRS